MKLLALLVSVLLALPAVAATVVLNWAAPTTYADNLTPIPAGTVVTYNVFAGPCGGPLQQITTTALATPTLIVPGVPPGAHGYAITAIIANQPSAQQTGCLTVPAAPAAPGSLQITPVTTSTIAYMLVPGKDTYGSLIIGSVPLGTPCDYTKPVVGYFVIPSASVTFTGALKPTVVLGSCL
jgi:hypothetical protein